LIRNINPTQKIWDQYATGSIPKNFVIDKKGLIRYISVRNSEGNIDKLASEIKKLLNE
jgi:peroxiredoxin